MKDALDLVLQGFAFLSSVAALFTLGFEFSRQGRARERSLRPAVGLIVACLGLFAVLLAGGWLATHQVAPFSSGGRLWAVAIGAGLVVFFGGLVFVAFVPTADGRALNRIASVAEQRVQERDRHDGFTVEQLVERGVRVLGRSGPRVRPLTLARLADNQVTMMCGGAGSGKTIELRQFIRSTCARRRRRPDTVVLYVDLADAGEIECPVTVDVVVRHILAPFAGDTSLVDEVSSLLIRADPRIRCVFAVDFGCVLPAALEQEYLSCVRELTARHRRNQALVVSRRSYGGSAAVLEVAHLDRLRRERLLRQHSMPRTAYRDLARRLDADPELQDVAESPAMLALLARQRDAMADVAIPDRHGFVERLVGLSLATTGDPKTARHEAELAAYRITTGDERALADYAAAPWAQAVLGTVERGRFRFHTDVVRTHLAAAYLARVQPTIDITLALTSPDWCALLIAALRRNDSATTTWLVEVIGEFVRREGNDGIGNIARESPSVPGAFSWPSAVFRALEVLCDGMMPTRVAMLPEELRSTCDGLVRQALADGGRAQQQRCATLIPLVDVATARAVIERLVAKSGDEHVLRTLIARLPSCPGVYAALQLRTRVSVLVATLFIGRAPTTSLEWTVRHEDEDAANAVQEVARVARTAAVGSLVYATALVVNNPGSLPVAAVLAALAAGYLMGDVGVPRMRRQVIDVITVFFCFMLALVTVAAGLRLAEAVEALFGFNFAPGLTSLVAFCLLSWPAAALLCLAVTPEAAGRLWLPQLGLLRAAWSAGVPSTWREMDLRRKVTDWLWPRRVAAGVVCATAFGVLAIGLPVPTGDKEAVDGLLSLVGFAAFAVFVAKRRRSDSATWRRLRWDWHQLAGLDEEAFFRELTKSFHAGRSASTRFLTTVRDSEPGALACGVVALADMDNLMEFLATTLPDGQRVAIKEGFWRLAPRFHCPGFLDWARKFDPTYPGMLAGFASDHRDRELLSRAVLVAQEPAVRRS